MRNVEKEMVEYLIFISSAFDTTEPVAGRIPTSTRLSSSQAEFKSFRPRIFSNGAVNSHTIHGSISANGN